MTQQTERPAIVGWAAVAVVIAVVVLRAVAGFTPSVWWAIDPRALDTDSLGEAVIVEIGSTGIALTDALAIAALGLAVVDALIRRRRVRVGLIGLWAVGLAFALWQGTRDADSLRLGVTWAGTLAIALAAVHLAACGRMRSVMLAAVIALIVPLGMQAVQQVTIEHAATVEHYMENRAEFARQRGWEDGSPAQRKYEERLMQVEATGRFGFSNVFGSVMMTLSLVALGATAALLWRDRRAPLGYIVAGVALLGLVTLGLTFSKGALLALGAAVGGTVVVAIATRWLPGPGVWWRLAAVGIVAAGMLGVFGRGMLGEPETAAGERSLLFRWHYWQAAARMVADHPVAGVGPGRFQDAYLTRKNPLNPEEPADAHNVFVAYVSTLGLGGWAWSAVLVALLVSVGAAAAGRDPTQAVDVSEKNDPPPDDAPLPGAALRRWLVAGALLAAMMIQIAVERDRYHTLTTLIWLGGLIAMVALAMALCDRAVWRERIGRLALFAAATAMLLHAQIEMSLTQTMSGPILAAVLGIAAAESATAASKSPRHMGGIIGAALVGAAVIATVFIAVVPTARRDAALERAARTLRGGFLTSPYEATDRWLATAQHAMPQDRNVAEDRATILMELAARPDTRAAAIAAALDALNATPDETAASRPDPGYWNLLTILAERAAELTGDRAWLERAYAAAEQRLVLDPYGIAAHAAAADLADRLDRRARAAELYRRVLELDEQSYLDPNRRLDEERRAAIEARLGGGEP